jgi:GDPmannose 4,6-dehydratase
MKFALISGITGQDGSWLSEFLLEKEYNVYGIIRRSSTFNTKRIDHIRDRLTLFYGDMTDITSLINSINKIKKDMTEDDILEVYHLAAQSHVAVSFELPIYTTQCDALGTINFLEAIKQTEMIKRVRFYNAATSELYGEVLETPQNENTPFNPRSPYAIAKQYAFYITKNFREGYNMFACSGILFNHEGPRRGENFVTRKITIEVGRISRGESECLYLGNLNSKRDWGSAKEYVVAMWKMLQQEKPKDYVIGSGETHSVREFVEIAFKTINIDIEWEGTGLDEIGKDKNTGKILVKVNPRYFRPTDVVLLHSDPSIARKELDWNQKTSFKDLVIEMVKNDL